MAKEKYYCPDCGTRLKDDGFYWVCDVCDLAYDVLVSGELKCTKNDEYDSLYSSSDDRSDACRACGGDYPNCIDSCPLCDD